MRKDRRKNAALGMNYSTAQKRLDRDLLFHFANKLGHVCYRCQQPMTRDTFSVEHKTPWQTARNPTETFFDLENVTFSHHRCNSIHSQGRST